jgi:ABC-type Mn2+/Zn2+ transport system ATPase subunit
MKEQTSIDVKGLQMGYHGNVVLKSVDVVLETGKIIGIIGLNGSGKSTFIKGILGIVSKMSGTVTFFNQSLNAVRNRIAYVPQRESVDWDFPISVKELVEMGVYQPTKWWKKSSAADQEKIKQAIEKVGLTAFASRQIGQLSGGQQQRAFVARALVQDADLIIMDEPFVGIDMSSQEAILLLLQELRNEGKTILIVHHDLATVANYFDKVMLFNNELVAYGSINEVITPAVLAPVYGTIVNFSQIKQHV